MNLFISSAFAEGATKSANQFSFTQFLPFVLIFFVFYFLLIKPQQKKMKDDALFNEGLKKGDEIYTKSGILGKITGLNEKVATVEVADGMKLKFLRSQIAGSSKNIFSSEKK